MELKPCPFCGSEPIIKNKGFYSAVACSNLHCQVRPQTEWIIQVFGKSCFKAWNTRKEISNGA